MQTVTGQFSYAKKTFTLGSQTLLLQVYIHTNINYENHLENMQFF